MRIGGSQFVIDTNIILRYILRDSEELAIKAKTIIDAVQTDRLRVWCHPVILAEVVWVMSSYYKIPPAEIVENVRPIVQMPSFVVPDKAVLLDALRLYEGAVPHFADACACAAAMKETSGKLLSFDRKLSSVEGISQLESLE